LRARGTFIKIQCRSSRSQRSFREVRSGCGT